MPKVEDFVDVQCTVQEEYFVENGGAVCRLYMIPDITTSMDLLRQVNYI